MLVEIDYPDGNGACPFCGGYAVRTAGQFADRIEFGSYECAVYPCRCRNGHIFFVSVETTLDNDQDEMSYFQRMFVFYQDWEDHVEINIEPGPEVMSTLDNEDDIWQITIELLK